MSYRFKTYWTRFFSILFCFKKKIFVVGHPIHPNLGDQAQLMCTDNWLSKNYSSYKVFHIGFLLPALCGGPLGMLINSVSSILTIALLKLKISNEDFFLGHSGYYFVDHHGGWKAIIDFMRWFPKNKMIIFPQTINFYAPVIKQMVSEAFSKHNNVTLLCRDEVSFDKAKEMFPSTKILLYPDIVTSLIGTRHYDNKREGVLFIMRDDIEAFYKPEQIQQLKSKFGSIRSEQVDTTLKGISTEEMDKHREKYINNMIEKISTCKVVITDRYHGTIFSVIAGTPVVVISSADHKLSSGIKWFPKEKFGKRIFYAENLDTAYLLAKNILEEPCLKEDPCTFFKDEYWDTLINKLN